MLHALQPRAPAAPVPAVTTAEGPAARARRVLRCRRCARAIARPDDATAQQGRQRVMESFDFERVLEQSENLYRQVA